MSKEKNERDVQLNEAVVASVCVCMCVCVLNSCSHRQVSDVCVWVCGCAYVHMCIKSLLAIVGKVFPVCQEKT